MRGFEGLDGDYAAEPDGPNSSGTPTKEEILRMRKTRFIAAAGLATAALAVTPAANAATGSGGQLVTGIVTSSISVVGAPVTLTGFTPGAATPATGSGAVTVVSTDPYCLS